MLLVSAIDKVKIAESNGNVQTVDSTAISSMFDPETLVTANGHNGSYTIYSDGGYTVITPVRSPLKWHK